MRWLQVRLETALKVHHTLVEVIEQQQNAQINGLSYDESSVLEPRRFKSALSKVPEENYKNSGYGNPDYEESGLDLPDTIYSTSLPKSTEERFCGRISATTRSSLVISLPSAIQKHQFQKICTRAIEGLSVEVVIDE